MFKKLFAFLNKNKAKPEKVITETEVKKEEEIVKTDILTKNLKFNLNNKDVILVDYENCSFLPDKILTKAFKGGVCYVFLNMRQRKHFEKEISDKNIKGHLVPIYLQHSSKNFLDTGIGMFVGMIYAVYTPKSVDIYSNDQDYASIAEMTNYLGIKTFHNVCPNSLRPLTDGKIKKYINRLKKEKVASYPISFKSFKKKLKHFFPDLGSDKINYLIEEGSRKKYLLVNEENGQKTIMIAE